MPPLWRVALFGDAPRDDDLRLSPATTGREAAT